MWEEIHLLLLLPCEASDSESSAARNVVHTGAAGRGRERAIAVASIGEPEPRIIFSSIAFVLSKVSPAMRLIVDHKEPKP